MNNKVLITVLAVLLSMVSACEKQPTNDPNDTIILQKDQGIINIIFKIPERNVPVDRIHRLDLSIAEDALSLYSGYFLVSANVSDDVSSYSFVLDEGEYYYQAGITCACSGDTCLWDGFPGGQWGTKWDVGKIEIIKGETLYKELTFNK